jgi:hypothetical protein
MVRFMASSTSPINGLMDTMKLLTKTRKPSTNILALIFRQNSVLKIGGKACEIFNDVLDLNVCSKKENLGDSSDVAFCGNQVVANALASPPPLAADVLIACHQH